MINNSISMKFMKKQKCFTETEVWQWLGLEREGLTGKEYDRAEYLPRFDPGVVTQGHICI